MFFIYRDDRLEFNWTNLINSAYIHSFVFTLTIKIMFWCIDTWQTGTNCMHAYNSIMRISNRQFSFYRMSIFAIRENKKKKRISFANICKKNKRTNLLYSRPRWFILIWQDPEWILFFLFLNSLLSTKIFVQQILSHTQQKKIKDE